MLDVRKVTEQLDVVKEGLAKRGFSDDALLGRLTSAASSRRAAITELEAMRKQLNDASAAMSTIADKKSAEFQAKREELRTLGDSIKAAEAKAKGWGDELEQLLLSVPNVPHASVPVGADESANPVVRVVGDKPGYAFAPKDHVDLGVGLGIVDFDRATKISGARFSVLRGAGAKLERALIQFMLEASGGKGLTIPPETVQALSAHDWPGNVRELRNILERAIYMAQATGSTEIGVVTLPSASAGSDAAFHFEPEKSYRETRAKYDAEFEKRYVKWLLGRHHGNISAAAREAKMDRKHLHDMAKKHGLRGEGAEES